MSKTEHEEPMRRLHAAAELIRTRAEAASPGPWISDDDEQCWRLHSDPDPRFPTTQILKAPKHGTPYAEYWPDPADADHIVRWNPRTAKAVANVLRSICGTDPKRAGNGMVWITALELIRVLGADQPDGEATS
jgi:hypothetical protein